MSKPLVSIIIPVYNVEPYLAYCMQSVLAQKYKDIEIILVDDGSTDSSGQLCDEYAQKDERVKVVHKTNGGLSSARNAGLEIATGEYLTYIDSDDYIHIEYISKMMKYMLSSQNDMIICSYKKVLGEEDIASPLLDESQKFVYNREQTQIRMAARKLPMYAHGKLYKIALAKYLQFPVGKLYEDVPTLWEVAKHVNQITYITEQLYFYRQRVNSIVNASYKSGRMDQLYFAEQMLQETINQEEIHWAVVSRCFFAASDNFSLVTRDFPQDYVYLRAALKKYRRGVLKDKYAEKSLKIMAMLAYISPNLVRVAGKAYKKYNYHKWKNG